jgi:hypothetical protein
MARDCFLSIFFLNRLNVQLVSSKCLDVINSRLGDLLVIFNGSQLWGLSPISSRMKNIFSLALRGFSESIVIKFDFCTVRLN